MGLQGTNRFMISPDCKGLYEVIRAQKARVRLEQCVLRTLFLDNDPSTKVRRQEFTRWKLCDAATIDGGAHTCQGL